MHTKLAYFSVSLVTVLAAFAASPASAGMTWLGSVYLTQANGQASPANKPPVFGDFGGGVERLGFRAENGSVSCNDILARFSDGTSYDVYKGYLASGRENDVTMPDKGAIRALDFQCRGDGFTAASIDVLADPGKHMAEWRSNPDWNSKWWYRFQSAPAAPAAAQQVSQAATPRANTTR